MNINGGSNEGIVLSIGGALRPQTRAVPASSARKGVRTPAKRKVRSIESRVLTARYRLSVTKLVDWPAGRAIVSLGPNRDLVVEFDPETILSNAVVVWIEGGGHRERLLNLTQAKALLAARGIAPGADVDILVTPSGTLRIRKHVSPKW